MKFACKYIHQKSMVTASKNEVCPWLNEECLFFAKPEFNKFSILKDAWQDWPATAKRCGVMPVFIDGHHQSILCCTFSPDGRYLVTGGKDNAIMVWSVTTGKLLRKLHGHDSWVECLAFDSKGSFLISGSRDKTIRIWDFNRSCLVKTIYGHRYSVLSISFLEDCRYIVSGSADETVRIWEASSGKLCKILNGHLDQVNEIAVCDGLIFSAGNDGRVSAWNPETGKCKTEFDHLGWPVISIHFIERNQQFLSISQNGTARLWNYVTGELQKYFQVTDSYRLVFEILYPNQEWLLEYFLKLSDDPNTSSWELELFIRGIRPETHIFKLFKFSPEYKTAAICLDRTISIYRSEPLSTFVRLSSENNIHSIAFSPDGKRLAAGGENGQLWLWSLNNGQLIDFHLGNPQDSLSAINYLHYTQDGKYLISGAENSEIVIRRATNNDMLIKFTEAKHTFQNRKIFLPQNKNGEFIFMVRDGEIFVRQAVQGNLMKFLNQEKNQFRCQAAISIDQDGVYYCSGQGEVTSGWEINIDFLLHALSQYSGYNDENQIFTPDGRFFLDTDSYSNRIKIVSFETREVDRMIVVKDLATGNLALSPNGKLLATGYAQENIGVLDFETGKLLWKIDGYNAHDDIVSIAFTPNNHILAVNYLNSVKFFNSSNGKLLFSITTLPEGASAVITPEGYFSGSGPFSKFIGFGSTETLDIHPYEEFAEEFYQPQKITSLLSNLLDNCNIKE